MLEPLQITFTNTFRLVGERIDPSDGMWGPWEGGDTTAMWSQVASEAKHLNGRDDYRNVTVERRAALSNEWVACDDVAEVREVFVLAVPNYDDGGTSMYGPYFGRPAAREALRRADGVGAIIKLNTGEVKP